MKFIMMTITMMLIVCLTSSNAYSQNESDEFKNTVQEMFDIYSTANMKGDLETFLSLHDGSIIKMPPNMPALQGKSIVEGWKRKGINHWNIETMSIQVEEAQATGDWGYAWGTYKVKMTSKSGSKSKSIDGKYLDIFKKQPDGSWKMYIDCFNSNVPPK